MKHMNLQFLYGLTILLGGLLLIPLAALPSRPFTWQNYAPLHVAPPSVDIGTDSSSGAYLSIKGAGFQPDHLIYLSLNQHGLARAQTNSNGEFALIVRREVVRDGENELTATALDVPNALAARSLQFARLGWSSGANGSVASVTFTR